MTGTFKLRPDVDIIRSGPDAFLLTHLGSGRHFECTARERFLIEWLRRGDEADTIRQRYEARFGEPLAMRTLLDFVEQLRVSGLLDNVGVQPALPAPPVQPAMGAARGTNMFFDLLAVAFGWVVQPWLLWSGTVVALWMAASAITLNWSAYKADLSDMVAGLPLLERVGIMVVIGAFAVGLVRALFTGLVTRAIGGRIASFRLKFYRRVLPTITCDTGDSFALADDPGRWLLLTAGLVAQAWFAALAAVLWIAVRDAGRPAGGLAVLSAAAFMLLLILGLLRDGYPILCHLVEDARLMERAEAERSAWFAWRPSPEPLNRRERFWLRVFGLFLYVAKPVVYTLVFGLGGYAIAVDSGGFGAVVVVGAGVLWFADGIKGGLMSVPGAKGLVRFGGNVWFRWSFRLVVLVLLVLVGFIPYNHEISGRCRVSSVTEHGIRAQIASEIIEVYAGEGDAVKPGDRIVRLNDRDVRANIAGAESSLERAKADLSLKQKGTRPEDIEAAREQMELARIKYVYSTNEFARADSLFKDGSITPEDYDQARMGRDSAEKELLIAQQMYISKTNGFRPEEIEASQAAVKSAQTELEYHQMQLSLLQVTTRVAGVVSTPYMKGRMGQVVQLGDLIAVVQDPSQLLVEMAARDTAASFVRTGMPVNVRLFTTHGELLTGRVKGIAGDVDEDRMLRARPFRSDREAHMETSVAGGNHDASHVMVLVDLDEGGQGLRPGMTGYARIVIAEDCFWRALYRPIVGFFRTEVWSWLP